MLQSGICHCRSVQIQVFQIFQPLQVFQACIGDLSPFKVQSNQSFRILDVDQPRIRDVFSADIQLSQFWKVLERSELSIFDLSVCQVKGNIKPRVILCQFHYLSASLANLGHGRLFSVRWCRLLLRKANRHEHPTHHQTQTNGTNHRRRLLVHGTKVGQIPANSLTNLDRQRVVSRILRIDDLQSLRADQMSSNGN